MGDGLIDQTVEDVPRGNLINQKTWRAFASVARDCGGARYESRKVLAPELSSAASGYGRSIASRPIVN